jgi:hypothetical protein
MSRNLDAYIDAVRERDALRRAVADEGETPARLARLRVATAEVKLKYARLTGGQIGEARRILGASA